MATLDFLWPGPEEPSARTIKMMDDFIYSGKRPEEFVPFRSSIQDKGVADVGGRSFKTFFQYVWSSARKAAMHINIAYQVCFEHDFEKMWKCIALADGFARIDPTLKPKDGEKRCLSIYRIDKKSGDEQLFARYADSRPHDVYKPDFSLAADAYTVCLFYPRDEIVIREETVPNDLTLPEYHDVLERKLYPEGSEDLLKILNQCSSRVV